MRNDVGIKIGHQYSMTDTQLHGLYLYRGNDPEKSQIFTKFLSTSGFLLCILVYYVIILRTGSEIRSGELKKSSYEMK